MAVPGWTERKEGAAMSDVVGLGALRCDPDTTWTLTRKTGSNDWTRAMSRSTLEIIYSRSTDEYTRRECLREMDRRDNEGNPL